MVQHGLGLVVHGMAGNNNLSALGDGNIGQPLVAKPSPHSFDVILAGSRRLQYIRPATSQNDPGSRATGELTIQLPHKKLIRVAGGTAKLVVEVRQNDVTHATFVMQGDNRTCQSNAIRASRKRYDDTGPHAMRL
jgi:hypothetical protein